MAVTPRLRNWLDTAVWLLLPAACLGCGAALPRGRSPFGLCCGCRRRLERITAACPLCGRELAAAGGATPLPLCGRCRAQPPAFDRLLVGWHYRPPLVPVVRALKFSGLDYLGAHLGEGLYAALGPELDGIEAVVPVPLHWRRRLVRGYNQAELIAWGLAPAMGVPVIRALQRSRATPPQTALGRSQRLSNLRRAFRCRRRGAVAGRSLLLVDDVVTTGATLAAAARELKRAGAARVVALVAARTPE